MWPSQKVSFCKISNSREFYELCTILELGDWIFRGHENSQWLLTHSLERMWQAKEDCLDEMKKQDIFSYYCSGHYNGYDKPYDERYENEYIAVQRYKMLTHNLEMRNIEALCNIQHYEGKTRLLDFSFSICVALYFAFENKYILKNKIHNEQDNQKCYERCIWAINYKHLKDTVFEPFKRYCQEKGIKIEELKQMPMDKYNDILDDANFSGKLDPDEFEFRNMCLDSADNFICKSIPEESQYKDKILPIEIPGVNPRLDAQNGLFLFPTEMIPFSESLSKTFNLQMTKGSNGKNCYSELDENQIQNKDKIYIGIDTFKQNFDRISGSTIIKIIFEPEFTYYGCDRKILKAANVNARNIYPDDIGIAKSIEYW